MSNDGSIIENMDLSHIHLAVLVGTMKKGTHFKIRDSLSSQRGA